MVKPRHLLPVGIICSIMLGCALAQTNLTQIRDTVLNANGTPFNGTVIITWNGPTSSGSGNISPVNTSARIYSGALSVLLVPSTTAAAGAYYQAVYHSNDGLITWTETWNVLPSTIPLTLNQVRQSTNQGSGSGGTGTGTSGGPYATLPIAITDVTNLGANLNAISNALNTLTTQVTGLQSATSNLAAETSAVFVDAETPSGAMNGSNTVFTLANRPVSAASVTLFRNGTFQLNGSDYTVSGSTITFAARSIPVPGDILQTFYRTTGSASILVDNEVPSGTIDGTNTKFSLANAPNPGLSLKLFKNGILQSQNGDYTLSGSTITFIRAATLQPGDSILASYRHQ